MFQNSHFDIFNDKTLDGRMAKIRAEIGPEFTAIGDAFLPCLERDGQTWYYHIAKHLRRTTNPPENTWVAFSPNKRGYKMLPHFELGLWEDHLYLYLAVEANMKPAQTAVITEKLRSLGAQVADLPKTAVLSPDHMVNAVRLLADYDTVVNDFETKRQSEVLIGYQIHRGDAVFGTATLLSTLIDQLETLLPLYEKLR